MKEKFQVFESQVGKENMDTIANMLISIKNGGLANKDFVVVPYSLYKKEIARALFDSGYISSFDEKKREKGNLLEIGVAYSAPKIPKIKGIKRVSKSSRRIYIGFKNIKSVKHGHGDLFLSTPKGILTGRQAKKELVGGERLFEIW